jgi:hypothetical protein
MQGTIRQIFYTLNVTAEQAYGNHVGEWHNGQNTDLMHVLKILGHCFEYLRQSLTCNADLTLEYTAVGWEVEHRCKDRKEVEAFIRANNKGNPDFPEEMVYPLVE